MENLVNVVDQMMLFASLLFWIHQDCWYLYNNHVINHPYLLITDVEASRYSCCFNRIFISKQHQQWTNLLNCFVSSFNQVGKCTMVMQNIYTYAWFPLMQAVSIQYEKASWLAMFDFWFCYFFWRRCKNLLSCEGDSDWIKLYWLPQSLSYNN